jgi:hypothetical protein
LFEFNKMTILTATTTEPTGAVLRQRSYLLSALGPLVQLALQSQQILLFSAFYLLVRTYFAARILTAVLLLASRVVAFRTWLTSKFLAVTAFTSTRQLAWRLWDSKPSRRFRRKLEFEFFILILGPGGNALFLLLFWPGWLMVLVGVWALWPRTG